MPRLSALTQLDGGHLTCISTADGRSVTGLGRRVWSGSSKEPVVVAREPWMVTLHEHAGSAPAWVLPVRVSGPTSFTLVAVWTLVFQGTPGYVAQLDRAADWVEPFSTKAPTVLAGDLNAPISSTQNAYDKVERRLNELGLVDAYRVAHGLELDEQPTEPTYFHHRRQDQPFHIDHVFVPPPGRTGRRSRRATSTRGSPPVAATTSR
ncbi:endonuclease/exonuclease/phosphatase family protein [Modestobacter sp. KNN46-3]|jgi:endonuclease/exonuclease/phosphatase (EEP) superfamily protein YafD|uniref:endonuclease/exonuclease/phosphatase family protein n=1 Tax=Modestobacter sp. KNN46-3 TaxID=2711218 RepID=UPI0013E03424|nr:endonuclease/exonuclease/phosphatase family protein [Modestobacter sp. KNN46-3]